MNLVQFYCLFSHCFWIFSVFLSNPLPTQRVSFHISCRAGLLVTNSFSFCGLGNSLFLLLFGDHWWQVKQERLEPEATVHVFLRRNPNQFHPGAWSGSCSGVSSYSCDKTNGPSQVRHFVWTHCILPEEESSLILASLMCNISPPAGLTWVGVRGPGNLSEDNRSKGQ